MRHNRKEKLDGYAPFVVFDDADPYQADQAAKSVENPVTNALSQGGNALTEGYIDEMIERFR